MRRLAPPLLVLIAALGAVGFTRCAPPYNPGPDWRADPTTSYIHTHPFMVCTRAHESDRNDAGGQGLHDQGYQAVSRGGTYRGAYQFDQRTWDGVASRIAPGLVGRDPASAWVIEQDGMAWQLYRERGNQPWGGRC